jgi:hypothetical protein
MAHTTTDRRGTVMTDAELIVASREDPLAFRQLYDRWADRLLAYFYQRVCDGRWRRICWPRRSRWPFERRRRFRDIGRAGGAWLSPYGSVSEMGGDGSRSIVGLDATGRRGMVFAGPDPSRSAIARGSRRRLRLGRPPVDHDDRVWWNRPESFGLCEGAGQGAAKRRPCRSAE